MSGHTSIERLPSHIPGLDTILSGGFLKAGMYIVQGSPGTGKTTLANQISFNHVAHGGRALYMTLLAEYHARLIQHLGSMSFFDMSKIPDHISYLSGFHAWRQDGTKGLLDLIRREIGRSAASILILDGFGTAQHAALSPQDFNEFVHELQGIAIATDCTMFLLTSGGIEREAPEYTIVDGIIELSDELLDWSAASTLQVVKLRGSSYLRGKHSFMITDDGLVVYPRLEALFARPSRPDPGGQQTVSSGLPQLDALLGGGLPEASTTMLMGPSGIGKTTLGLHFLATATDAAPGLLFGFYETPPRIHAKIDAICKPMRPLLDSGAVSIMWQAPTDGLVDSYADRMLDHIERTGARRLFIDGLGGFQRAITAPARAGHMLTALMNELRVRGVTTIYSSEVADIIGPHIRPPISDLSSLAENLILMRYIERSSKLHRLISILKVRDSNFDASTYRFHMTGSGIAIDAPYESVETVAGIEFLGAQDSKSLRESDS